MKSLISQLKKHSLYDFPVEDVSSTILNSEIQEDIIKKYSHFSKSMYTTVSYTHLTLPTKA